MVRNRPGARSSETASTAMGLAEVLPTPESRTMGLHVVASKQWFRNVRKVPKSADSASEDFQLARHGRPLASSGGSRAPAGRA